MSYQSTCKPFEGPDGATLSLAADKDSKEAWTDANGEADYPLQWNLTTQNGRAVECVTVTVGAAAELAINQGRSKDKLVHTHRHSLVTKSGESYPITRTLPIPHNPATPCGEVVLSAAGACQVRGCDIGFRKNS